MKAGYFAIAIGGFAAAQPHKQHQHQHHHEKRDVVTEVQYVTADNVVVYVDQYGVPVTTSYAGQAAPTPAAEAFHVIPAAHEGPAAVATAAAAVASPEAEALHVAAHAHKTLSASTATSTVSTSGNGICYSPYNADGSCKTQSQVDTDFEVIGGYDLVRIYGVDCDQVSTVLSAAKTHNMKIFAGIYDITQVESAANTIVSAIGGDWDMIDTVSVGNELLNSHQASAAELVSAINQAKAVLKPAGYTGPVVYVDTFNALIAQNSVDSSLCEASDYSAANAHSFFDALIEPSDAGAWVTGTAKDIAASCPGKKVVITESGWPSAGTANGAAIPSLSNQQTAIASIKSAYPDGGVFLFSAFNDLWKANAAWNFFAEQSYGIYGNAPSSG